MRQVDTPSLLANVFETPLKSGLFGTIRLNTTPFQIVLNETVLEPRKQVSLVHEMLHAFMELHKMHDFPHDKLHDIAVFVHGEILPVLVAHSKDLLARGSSPESVITNPKRKLPNVSYQHDRASRDADERIGSCEGGCQGRCRCPHPGRYADEGFLR